jgi:hypothetical protein
MGSSTNQVVSLLLPSEDRQWAHNNKPKESSTVAPYGKGRNGDKMNAWDGKGIQEKRWKEMEVWKNGGEGVVLTGRRGRKAMIIGWARDEIPEKEEKEIKYERHRNGRQMIIPHQI